MSYEPSTRSPDSPIEYRLAVLQEVFPEGFKEDSLDANSLIEFVGGTQGGQESESPGLRWPGRTEAIQSLRRPPASALEPIDDFIGQSSHVFITGDNYEVMKLLQPAYAGSVKMAFVEPSYNNGLDEIYRDNFDDPWGRYAAHSKAISEDKHSPAMVSTAGRGRHARWLNMMLPRLYVTRNMLADDGVIFVTIDDNESHRLHYLMDEVFGPENFVCTFVWEKRYSPAPDAEDNIGYVHEYILCYRKSTSFEAAFLPMSENQRNRYRNPDNDSRGAWKPADYTCRFTADERHNQYYPITHPKTGAEVWPKRSRVWACTPEEHERQKADGRVWWGLNNENSVPARKAFLTEIRQGLMPATLLKHTEVGHTDDATKEIRKFFPDLNVTPKPVALVRHFIKIAGATDGDIVLDPFARVGTTAEAVVRENAETGSQIRFLLVGLPEPIQGGGSAKTLPEVALGRARECLGCLEEGSQRLRTFRQRSAVLLVAQPSPDAAAQEADEQLQVGTQYFDAQASEETLAVNIALASGFSIDGTIERSELAEGIVAYIFNGDLAVCVTRPLTAEAIESLGKLPINRVTCLEAGFAGQDELLLNTRVALNEREISFETI